MGKWGWGSTSIYRGAKEILLDVNVLRRAAGGMWDHILVEARLKVVSGFREKYDACERKGETSKASESGILQRYQR